MLGRPLCLFTVVFVLGIVCTRLSTTLGISHALPMIIAAAMVLLPIIISLAVLARSKFFGVLLAVFGLLGILAAQLAQPTLPVPARLEPFFESSEIFFLAEMVKSPDFYPDKMKLPLSLKSVIAEGMRTDLEANITLTLGTLPAEAGTWLVGDRLLGRFILHRLHNFNNPGGFDYVRNRAEQGFYGRAYLPNDNLLLKLAPERTFGFSSLFIGLKRNFDLFRQKSLFWLRRHQTVDAAAFNAALLLGYRHLLSRKAQDHFNRAGVTHLLAISGLHLGMVSIAVFWFTRRLVRLLIPNVLRRTSDIQIALWVAVVAATAYAFVGGLALPTWRAALMLLLLCLALFSYRSPDYPSLVAAAALVMLVSSPNYLWHASFQLSFAAVIGILLFYPRLQKAFSSPSVENSAFRKNWLYKSLMPFKTAFLVSLAVNLAVLPIIAFHFHGLSLAGLFANVLLVPFVGFLALPLGLFGLTAYAINPGLALPIFKLEGSLVAVLQAMVAWFSQQSWAYIWVGLVPLSWVAIFYGILISVVFIRKLTIKIGIVSALLLIGFFLQPMISPVADHSSNRNLQVVVIDVGQGSSTLIRFPTGENMLVDGGGFYDDSFDMGRYVLAPFLWHEGIKKLDFVVLSHDHPDHRNGLRFILSHFDVGFFWQSGIVENNAEPNTLGKIALRRKIPIRELPDIYGRTTIGPCEVNILHPTQNYLQNVWDRRNLNDASLVVRIDYENTAVVLPSDIDESVERIIFSDEPSTGRVLLIAPHHGSAHSTSSFLLDHLRPDHIIFSCGYLNRFGFPAAEVLRLCNERGITIHRTDLHGAVKAVSNGRFWKIEHYLQ